jgi:hypothetical protein
MTQEDTQEREEEQEEQEEDGAKEEDRAKQEDTQVRQEPPGGTPQGEPDEQGKKVVQVQMQQVRQVEREDQE